MTVNAVTGRRGVNDEGYVPGAAGSAGSPANADRIGRLNRPLEPVAGFLVVRCQYLEPFSDKRNTPSTIQNG